jgi:23S rRNA (uracil1939-C5)-methyltransferase
MKYCPVYKKCGGCAYINTEYADQLKNKKEYIQSLFPKNNVEPVIGMKDPYHYRHKIYATFSHNRDGVIKCGMYEENTHKVIDTKMCLIQHVKANDILRDMCSLATKMHIESYDEDTGRGVLRHAYIRISHATNDVLLTIVIGSKNLPGSNAFVKEMVRMHPEIKSIVLNHNSDDTSMVLGKKNHVLYGKGFIEDEIMHTRFRISTNTFYQVNPVQTEKIYSTAIQMAQLKSTDTVLDMCCGIGTISLIASKKASFVLGVEINEDSIRDAIGNAKRNGIKNAQFIACDSEEFIEQLEDSPNVVFLDPPRNGFTEKFMKQLDHLKSDKIVYISCNPSTQARDIAFLKHYQIKKIVPVDNFPFTKHVETVVLLSHKKADSYIHIDVEFGEGEGKIPVDSIAKRAEAYKPKEKVTYKMIKEYIEAKYGFKVHTAYIAEVKRNLGLPMYDAPNAVEELKQPRKHPTPEKVEAIKDALRYFAVI